MFEKDAVDLEGGKIVNSNMYLAGNKKWHIMSIDLVHSLKKPILNSILYPNYLLWTFFRDLLLDYSARSVISIHGIRIGPSFFCVDSTQSSDR